MQKMYNFPGLKPGNKWCLCAARWAEAERYGFAPPVFLASTHEKTLEIVPLETLLKYALDVPVDNTTTISVTGDPSSNEMLKQI